MEVERPEAAAAGHPHRRLRPWRDFQLAKFSMFLSIGRSFSFEVKQVRSDNDASEVGILGHFGTTWDILGCTH